MKPLTLNLLLLLMPLSLLIFFFMSYPFSDQITAKTFSLSPLSRIQKNNIRVAAKAINGTILQPGEEFSFNKIVGPRIDTRGYRAAPSYLGPESPSTTGGGICLLSSALYQAALESGLEITQRVPHARTIKTIAAGLDSTVWYGQADLKFRNTFAVPLQIATHYEPQQLQIQILSKQSNIATNKAQIRTVICKRTKDQILVEVLKQQGESSKVVSRDLYDLAN